MKKGLYLIFALLFNSLGTAFMLKSNLGMTVWGGTALSASRFFGVSFGMGFLILSFLFYGIAVYFSRDFKLPKAILAFLSMYLYGIMSDYFISIVPDLTHLSFSVRLLIDFIGLLILNLGIAIHIKIDLALFPLDVYLAVMQKVFKSIRNGTYFTYFSAFLVFLILSYFNGDLAGLGLGTIMTLTFSGVNMDLYDRYIIKYM